MSVLCPPRPSKSRTPLIWRLTNGLQFHPGSQVPFIKVWSGVGYQFMYALTLCPVSSIPSVYHYHYTSNPGPFVDKTANEMTPHTSSFTPSSLSPLLLKTQSYICGQSKSDQLYVFDLLVTGKQSCSHRANCLWNLQVFFLFWGSKSFYWTWKQPWTQWKS